MWQDADQGHSLQIYKTSEVFRRIKARKVHGSIRVRLPCAGTGAQLWWYHTGLGSQDHHSQAVLPLHLVARVSRRGQLCTPVVWAVGFPFALIPLTVHLLGLSVIGLCFIQIGCFGVWYIAGP